MRRWVDLCDNNCEDMGGIISPVEELLLTRHFTTVGPGAIAVLGALVGSVGW